MGPDAYNDFTDKVRSLFGFVQGADSLLETYWETYTAGYHQADPRIGQSP